MNGHTFQDGIVFLHLQTIWGVLSVFGCDISASSWHARLLVLGALHNHLNSVTFFCHCVLKTDCKYRMNFGLYNIFFQLAIIILVRYTYQC